MPASRCAQSLNLLCIWLLLTFNDYGSVRASRMLDAAASVFAPITGRSRDGWSFNTMNQRRFVLEDMHPVPSRGTCKLDWYTTHRPGSGNSLPCNESGTASCLEPCMEGFIKLHNSDLCIQSCPAEHVGPARLCPISRTCIRAGVCPMQVDVPFFCTVPNQFMGSCAKQSYQAVIAGHDTADVCKNGTVYKDYLGSWHCVTPAGAQPCSAGFTNITELRPGLGARCQQVCPPWLVDCGVSCHMPGVPCGETPQQLCPIPPLEGCTLANRSRSALLAACQQEGFRSLSNCPLMLTMHGSCGGPKLQVAAGLRNKGFLRKVEAWWGPVTGLPLPDNFDGPLRAVRVTFSDEKQSVVFGNASLVADSSPRMTFKMDPNELVVGEDLWSSSSVMEGSHLTPLLAGFKLYTSDKNVWIAGGTTSWEGKMGNERIGQALSNWDQHSSVSGKALGVGLPVGAAAYSSEAGIHAFGIIYLARVLKQEL